jgi:acyl-CoA reductase-like NAD-dependent aldehyde dehydrogenase
MSLAAFPELNKAIESFNQKNQLGPDPLAAIYSARRKAFSLFSLQLSDADCELLRNYVFCYRTQKGKASGIPRSPTDAPITVHNFLDGEWRAPKKNDFATLQSQADNRIPLIKVPASTQEDVEQAVSSGYAYWKSMAWADEALAYRKQVIKNFSRLMHYFYEECLDEIRQQIPKTRLEADKDFWEAKRAADHLEGNAEVGLRGELVPEVVPGQTYWRNSYLPAGLAVVVTPMNFIYGIPGIQIVGAYLSGCPFIFKGHPFSALTNTTLFRMLLAAGADPRSIQKLEGFGPGVQGLSGDHRVAVVSVTGSAFTAAAMQEKRGLNRLRFEGGGCNWSWVDDGYSDEDLKRIAVRLTYSKLGFGSHKCTTLHGVSASPATLKKLLGYIDEEMGNWKVADPRTSSEDKVVSPLMTHKAQTLIDIVAAAKKAGVQVLREGGRADGEYGAHSEAVKPALLAGITPETKVTANWDGKGEQTFPLATTEFFMPILVGMERSFEQFLEFCLVTNPHDLATSIWSRDDKKLQRARRIIGGMLKENDGTDSALEWEEFGASGIGESGNMGVGEVQATLAIYCRRQKGRHLIF